MNLVVICGNHGYQPVFNSQWIHEPAGQVDAVGAVQINFPHVRHFAGSFEHNSGKYRVDLGATPALHTPTNRSSHPTFIACVWKNLAVQQKLGDAGHRVRGRLAVDDQPGGEFVAGHLLWPDRHSGVCDV